MRRPVILLAPVIFSHLGAWFALGQPEIRGLGSVQGHFGSHNCYGVSGVSANGRVVLGACTSDGGTSFYVAASWIDERGWAYSPAVDQGSNRFSMLLSSNDDGSFVSG